jgi:hypothetical protein
MAKRQQFTKEFKLKALWIWKSFELIKGSIR